MKKLFTSILAICFISAALFATTGATVKVGYYENEVFEEGASPDAVKTGYAYEYYRKISEYTGWKYEYVYGSYADLYNLLVEGKIDLLAGLAYKDSRKNIIAYPQAAMGNETYSLVKHDTDSSITTSYATLNGKTIGILNSAMVDVLNKFLALHNINAIVKTFDDYDILFKAFDSNEVDLLAAEGDGAYGRQHTEVLYPFGASDYFLCVNIKRPDLLNQLNEAQDLLSIEESGFLSSLKSRYYSVSVSSRAFTTAEKEWMEQNKSLTVGYLNNYLPYSDTDIEGNVNGLVKSYIHQIISSFGIEIKTSFIGFNSYDDMIAAVNNGQVDTVFPVGGGLYYSEENGIYQSNPVTSSITEIVYLNDSNFAREATFAINKNNRMQYYYVITNFPNAKIDYYNSIEECLEAVLKQKADCTTINGLRNDILKNRRYRNLSMRQLKTSDDRCFGVQIGNEGLLKLLNRGINIVGTEYAQVLSYRYSQQLYEYKTSDFIWDNMWLIGSILLFVAAIIVILLIRDSNHSKAALSAAEDANRTKTAFLNRMSHNMLTPMNAIIGFTELAKTNVDDKKLTADYLGKIADSSTRLLYLINDVLEISQEKAPRPGHSPDKADFRGKRVLLAEDNQMNQIIAVANLEKLGFAVEVANDGVEAVEKVSSNAAGWYDVVLMDIQMPNMDGYQATQKIRSLTDTVKAGVPIVAVTANATGRDQDTILKSGMNALLPKPYDIPQMINTLYSLLFTSGNN